MTRTILRLCPSSRQCENHKQSDGNLQLYESTHLLLLPLHVTIPPLHFQISLAYSITFLPFLSVQLTDAKCPILIFAICMGSGQWYQVRQVPIDVHILVMPEATRKMTDDE